MSTTITMPAVSVKETLLRKVSTLSADDCTKVLRYMKTLEEEWSDEEWEELCEEFEHSPEKATAKAERRAGFLAPK